MSADQWLKRQNRALHLRGFEVSLDVSGTRIRLRATLPPKPHEPPGPGRQQRISTGMVYPDQAPEAIALAEALGRCIDQHRLGVEPFDWAPWLSVRKSITTQVGLTKAMTGVKAIALAKRRWLEAHPNQQRAALLWEGSHGCMLKPLRDVLELTPQHLKDLVLSRRPRTSMRLRQGRSVALVARVMGLPESFVTEINSLAAGYTWASAKRREIPSEEQIEAAIDGLQRQWQWPAAIVATYGCRPHEAMLFADVLPSQMLRIQAGKTGSRQALPLPAKWIERWQLHDKCLPQGVHRDDYSRTGRMLTNAIAKAKVDFRPYDLRHAWAVRAIRHSRISPSLAAKSMGHSLTMHHKVYQRWFDIEELVAVYRDLNLDA